MYALRKHPRLLALGLALCGLAGIILALRGGAPASNSVDPGEDDPTTADGVHWAYRAPRKGALPKVVRRDWPTHAIDHFILARLERAQLEPSPDADIVTLLRRVHLDLNGLPPTPAEVDAFLADASLAGYERVVDRLLDSRRFGEHMAHYWLDAARYGDSNGLYHDKFREIWPYRNWVIRAFNRNMPYDRFLTEQLAGDLLPGATTHQQVATGFLRCFPTTSDSAVNEQEASTDQVIDMTDTTTAVTLGLTVACARCHRHRYDPISQEDYYRFFAFFNNLDGSGYDYGAAYPFPAIQLPSDDHVRQANRLRERIADIKRRILVETARWENAAGSERDGKAPTPSEFEYVWLDDAPPPSTRITEDPLVVNRKPFVRRDEGPVLTGVESL